MVKRSAHKSIVKPTITPVAAAVKPVETVKPDYIYQPTVEPTPEPTEQSTYARMHQAVQDWLATAEAPTWTRKLVATTLGLVASAGIFYMSMGLVDALCVAAITYTGVGFIAFLVAFLGIFAALMLSITTGTKVFEIAMTFNYSTFKRRVASFKTNLVSKFNRKEVSHA